MLLLFLFLPVPSHVLTVRGHLATLSPPPFVSIPYLVSSVPHTLPFFLSFYSSPLEMHSSAAFDPSLCASIPHSPAVAPDIKTNQP